MLKRLHANGIFIELSNNELRMNLSRVVTTFKVEASNKIMSGHCSGRALEAEAFKWEGKLPAID